MDWLKACKEGIPSLSVVMGGEILFSGLTWRSSGVYYVAERRVLYRNTMELCMFPLLFMYKINIVPLISPVFSQTLLLSISAYWENAAV